jgi:hypothetical protein
MLGTDKSRGYCFEMISADFLAGAHLENGDPEIPPTRSRATTGSCRANTSALFSHKRIRRHHESNSTEATVPATVSQIV